MKNVQEAWTFIPSLLQVQLRLLGAVGRAAALALAAILAPVLSIAAALAFAVILALAGVFGQVLLAGVLRGGAGEQKRVRADGAVRGYRLSVEPSSGSAHQSGEGCGQCEVCNGGGLHEEFLSRMIRQAFRLRLWNRSAKVTEKSDLQPGKVALPMSPV